MLAVVAPNFASDLKINVISSPIKIKVMNIRSKSISLGDKIFARVTRNGRTIFNYVSEKIATMSQLISELRLAMKDVQGLVMIHIRNYHQGWGEERPLMLYAERTTHFSSFQQKVEKPVTTAPQRKMFFPWETH